MKESLIDVPVLLIFFSRPDTFKVVFDKIKKARPSMLFLACDGPREGNETDKSRIDECKKIAENIDWDCIVYKDYLDENIGCGMRPQTAISWAFTKVDRLVILEDDCVPSDTFLAYAKELLEKYKNDERIGTISGLNHFKDWDCGGNSYCFTKNGAIWGWATWKRVWDEYDYSVDLINDAYTRRLLEYNLTGTRKTKLKKIDRFKQTNIRVMSGDRISYWDFQFGFLKVINSYLQIVPVHNQITNIGVGEGSTHFANVVNNKWEKGSLYFMPSETLDLPLKHPKTVMCDYTYTKEVDKKIGYPNFVRKNYRRLKKLIRIIIRKRGNTK